MDVTRGTGAGLGGGVNRDAEPAARRRPGASTAPVSSNFAGVLRRCLGVNCDVVFSQTSVNSTYCGDTCRASGAGAASAAPSAPAPYTAARSLRQRLVDVVSRLQTCLSSASSGAYGLLCPRVHDLMFPTRCPSHSLTLQGRDLEVKAQALVLMIAISSGKTSVPSFTEYHSEGFPGANEVVPLLKMTAAVSTVDRRSLVFLRSLSFTCGL